jgi:hypothetical protein
MLTIEKVKIEIPRLCGFKNFRILGKDEDIIRVFRDLVRKYNNFQNMKYYRTGLYNDYIHEKEMSLYDTVEEFKKIVERTDV